MIIETGLTKEPITVQYTNHRGETRLRRIRVRNIQFGTMYPWYTEPQWLAEVYDEDKKAIRWFALKDIKPPPVTSQES